MESDRVRAGPALLALLAATALVPGPVAGLSICRIGVALPAEPSVIASARPPPPPELDSAV